MLIKKLTFYIQEYVFVFPLYYLHEVSHWFIALLFYIFGTNQIFPRINVERLYDIEISETSNMTSSHSHHMSVTINVCNDNYITAMMITIAPVFMTILLFTISPWWLCIVYLNNISYLWLSVGDINSLTYIYTKVKRAKNIKKIKSCQQLVKTVE